MAAIPQVDYGQAQNLVSQQTQAFNDLLSQQKNEQQGLFGQYTTASNAQPKLADVLNTAQQQRGLGELQSGIGLFNQQSQGVKGLIDRLNENTQARTTGTGATQAYLDRMRASEGGSLNTQLSRLTEGLQPLVQAYGLASQDIGQLLSATQADQATALRPLELQINSLGDRFAREITGFTTNKQNELNVLLTKLQSEQQLKLSEWQQAADLAKQEAAFQQQRRLIAAEQNSRQSAIDTLTGKSGNTLIGGYTPKQGGGFAFTNAAGQPVSAATFASQNKIGIGDLLYRMGQSGDRYAAGVYNDMQSIIPYRNEQSAMDAWRRQYSPIFWGS